MSSRIDFTSGSVPRALIHFALPVMFALFLQAMYGTVDLLIVGQFASSTDVSAVATGSQIMQTVTNLISSLATGTTVLLGQKIGQKKPSEGGKIAGASLILFALIGIAFSLLLTLGAAPLSRAMNAPEAAFLKTVHYLSICGGGALIMIFYNLIGGLFRGMGDSRTPFIAVAIACVSNIVLDLLMVAVFSFGAAGAALATVLSQAISVLVSYHLISNRPLPFAMTRAHVTFHKETIKRILSLGIPLAVQDLFVGLSFLIILAIANSLGVNASAGVGVSENLRLHHAGLCCLYAIHGGLYGTKQGGWPHGPCHQGPSVCHGPFLRLRPYHGLFHLFSRRHPGRPVYLFPIRYGSGGRLPKSLRF